MDLILLTADLVEAIHDEVLNPGELPGLAMNKSLESALARVDNRIAYGMTNDIFEIASLYAMAISQGHCFNDANKRTAHQSMDAFLDLNGVQITWSAEAVGQKIIALSQGLIDDGDLAEWLRDTA